MQPVLCATEARTKKLCPPFTDIQAYQISKPIENVGEDKTGPIFNRVRVEKLTGGLELPF